ncbi:response regulator [uncultured Paludibaculum sp.]|uniref:response regulator n=1 Tax=uncultured Paludibaculum sp. TaxID=1765020 RepID=UPI002AAA78A4|nr:response regulator [uncultured Paludibaculum sp.]
MNILVVDDSKAMRMIVRRTLRQIGYGSENVQEASNGDEALALLKNGVPDLMLCDWNMPGMSGLELLRTIRENQQGTRFVFVTTECTEEMRNEAASAGADYLISKPFTADHFQVALDKVLRP